MAEAVVAKWLGADPRGTGTCRPGGGVGCAPRCRREQAAAGDDKGRLPRLSSEASSRSIVCHGGRSASSRSSSAAACRGAIQARMRCSLLRQRTCGLGREVPVPVSRPAPSSWHVGDAHSVPEAATAEAAAEHLLLPRCASRKQQSALPSRSMIRLVVPRSPSIFGQLLRAARVPPPAYGPAALCLCRRRRLCTRRDASALGRRASSHAALATMASATGFYDFKPLDSMAPAARRPRAG